MGTIEEELEQGKRHHQAGALEQAQRIYRQILQAHPNHPEALHLLGVVANQVGNHAAAVELIGAALRFQPDQAVYLCNMAKACAVLGRRDEALAHLHRAVRLEPSWAPGHYELALVLRGCGQLDVAADEYRLALHLQPDFVQAWYNLGNIHHERGQLDDAAACFRRVVELKPDHVLARFALGKVHHQQARLEQAVANYLETLRLKPDHAQALNNLGSIYQELGRLAEAEGCYREACRLRPEAAEAAYNLGNVLRVRGDLAEAVAWYRKAADLEPTRAAVFNSLGAALCGMGLFVEAVEAFRRALSVEPYSAETHCNLGTAWRLLGRVDQAMPAIREALRLDPTLAEAHHLLGHMLSNEPRHDEALACFRAAVRLKPGFPAFVSGLANLLTTMGECGEAVAVWEQGLKATPDNRLRVELATQLPPVYTSATELVSYRTRLEEGLKALLAEGVTVDLTDKPTRPLFYVTYQGLNNRAIKRDYARLHTAPSPALRPSARAGRGGKVHVGFLSTYFCEHTVGQFTQGMIEHLSRAQFFVTVFAVDARHDSVANALRAGVDRFVEVPHDLRTARRLVADQALDILYYPDIGMEPFTFALGFSRLAPVQCVGFGHPETTGLETIDYFISTEAMEAAEKEPAYTEKVIGLGNLPIYYYRPPRLPAGAGRAAFGLSAEDHVYACPQTLFKIHPDFDEIFAGILRGDPRGVLVLVKDPNPHWERLLRQRFAATLPDVQSRVRFLPQMPRAAFLNLMVQADVLLDPLHFGSGNTGFEGLAMGTPIVSLPAAFACGRVLYAMYRQMGMMDCVVRDAREYIDLALKIGTDPGYRDSLREKILALSSVLYENLTGVRQLEQFFLECLSP